MIRAIPDRPQVKETQNAYVRLTSLERKRRYCPTNNSKRLAPPGLFENQNLQIRDHLKGVGNMHQTMPVSTGRERSVGRHVIDSV